MSLPIRRTTAVFLVCAAIAGCLGVAVAHQTPGPDEAGCLSNLKQVSTGLLMYCQDYDERLPLMQSMAAAQKRLVPYTRSQTLFTCPATTKPYKTNPALSGKPLAVIAEPPRAVSFFDAVPHADTQYSVAYVDGHVRREAKVPGLAVKMVAKKVQSHRKKPRSRR